MELAPTHLAHGPLQQNYKEVVTMYKLTLTGESVIRLSDSAFIPFADGNRDYEEYKEWLSAGNTPEPAQNAAEKLAALKLQKLREIQAELTSTDYRAIKFAEGALTAEEFFPTKARREVLRAGYNAVESATTLAAVEKAWLA